MIRVRIMNWQFIDRGPHILLVSKVRGPGLIDEDGFDVEYNILYNIDTTVDISEWELIETSTNLMCKYVEITEEELALMLLTNS